jgi:hypothetical protein
MISDLAVRKPEMCKVTIRAEGGGFLIIVLLGRSHPGASDYWDGNWVRASVEVQAGGFHGSASGDLRTDELAEFHEQLTRLQSSLRGTAVFATMEEWLSIRVAGDGRGHMVFRCLIRDKPGIGNTLECTLVSDQTFTRDTVAELTCAVQAFPIIGNRERG